MGEGKLKQSDLQEDNLFAPTINSAQDLIKALDAADKSLKKNTDTIATNAKKVEKISAKGINNLIRLQKLMDANFKKAQSIDREKIKTAKLISSAENQQAAEARRVANQKAKIAKEQEAANRRAIADKKRLAIEQEKLINKEKKEKQALLDLNNEYKKLTSRTNKAQAEFKRLAAAHGVNSIQAKKAKVQFDALDRELRQVNNAARDGRRDVGRYGKAFEGVRGSALRMLGALGLLGGGMMAIRGAFSTLTEFDEKLADIQKTTGLTKEGAREVSKAMLEIDTKTAVSELQELISAGGRLGIEGTKNLVDFATAADKVFVALGDDLEGSAEEIATELGKISSLFGLDVEFGIGGGIERVGSIINELAATSKAAAQPLLEFTARVAGFSDVLNIEEVAAFGTIFDEGGVSMEVAASTMNKVLPNMVGNIKELAEVTGLSEKEFKALLKSNPAQALIEVAKAAKGTEGGLEELVKNQALFGKTGARALPVLNALVNGTDDYAKFLKTAEEQLEKNNSVTDEFNTKNDTLSATLSKAKKKLQEQILAFDENTNATQRLKDVIVFLTQNLGTIVTVLGKVVKAYIAYRVVVKSLKLLDQIKNWKAVNKAVNENGNATKKAAKSAKKFGSAIKSMGLAVAIAGLIELALAWHDVASGAAAARVQTELYNLAAASATKTLTGIRENLNKTYQDEINAINLARAAGDLSAEQAEIDTKKALSDQQKRIEGKISEIRLDREALLIQKERAVALSKRLSAESKDAFGNVRTDVLGLAAVVRATKAQKVVMEMNATLKFQRDLVDGLRSDHSDLNQQVIDSNISVIELGRQGEESGKGHSESLEKQVSLLREIEDEQIKQIKNAQDLATIQAGTDARRSIEDIDVNASAQQRADLTIEIEKNLLLELTRIDKEFFDQAAEIAKQAEEEARQAREAAAAKRIEDFKKSQADLLKAKKLELLKSNKEQEDINKEFLEFEIELLQLRTQLTLDEQISLEEKKRQLKNIELAEEKKHQDELLALRKKVFDKLDEFAQKALDKQIENSQKKQELLDKEISNSQTLEDRLRESAQNGNAIASESLAAQSDITEEKERQKIAEAKKEERIEELKALWNTLNTFLSQGDNPLVAGGKSIGVVAGFKQLFSGITGFFKGTKGRLKDEHKAQVSGRDGHIVRVDGDEAILTGDKMDRLAAAGLTSTNDIVNSAIMNQQLIGVPMANHIDDRVVGVNTSAMESKLDAILSATKSNKPIMESPILRQGKIDGIVYAQENNGKLTRKWMHRI